MLGTFGGALDARKIDASDGRLHAEVRGEIESDQGVLVIRRVHVHFLLEGAEEVKKRWNASTGFMRTNVPYTGHCGQLSKSPRILNFQGQPQRKRSDNFRHGFLAISS